ncbi:MAG: hypothetical protein K2Y01_11160 [Rhabdochlamydiaceae bacterium]|nr:hypothetical protein [Rhabdochlamydiaceae bacterium]
MKKRNSAELCIDANFKKGTINTLFTFSGKGCDNAMGFYWMFGDGSSAHRDHLGIPEQHQYKVPGKYLVTVEAFGTDNTLVGFAKQIIHVERATVNEVVAKYKQRRMAAYKSANGSSPRNSVSR